MARSYGNHNTENTEPVESVKWYKNTSLLVGLGFLLVFLVVSGFNIASAISKSNKRAADRAALQQQYDELNAEISKIKDNPEYTEEEATEALNTASVEGKLVADAQNGWMHLHSGGEDGVARDGLTSDQRAEKAVEYHDVMVKYCPNSDVEIKRNWFTSIGTAGIDSLPFKWEFNSMYSYAGDNIPVMWTLFDGDVLYAYVIGNYDVASKTFSNLKLNYTAIGREKMMSYGSGVTEVSEDGATATDATATDATTTEDVETTFVDEEDAEKLVPTTEETTEVTTENTSETPEDVTTTDNTNDGNEVTD